MAFALLANGKISHCQGHPPGQGHWACGTDGAGSEGPGLQEGWAEHGVHGVSDSLATPQLGWQAAPS